MPLQYKFKVKVNTSLERSGVQEDEPESLQLSSQHYLSMACTI